MTPTTAAMATAWSQPDMIISQRTRRRCRRPRDRRNRAVSSSGRSLHKLPCELPDELRRCRMKVITRNRQRRRTTKPASGSTACSPPTFAELSRSRLKALILAGDVAIGGRTIRDPGHRVNVGEAIMVDVPPPEPPAPRPSRSRSRSSTRTARSSSSTSRGLCRPSRRRPRHRHAGQCADRPLRGQPFGHRRGAASRHRAPARQGHHRPHGGGQDRPRPPGAGKAIRRPRPGGAAVDAAISPSSGGCPTGPTAPSTSRSTVTRAPATTWRCARAGARR